MSENANRELIRQVYERLNARDLDWVLSHCAETVVVQPSAYIAAPPTNPQRGHEAVRRWWAAAVREGVHSLTAQRMEAHGSTVVVEGWITTRRGRSGMTLRARWRWVIAHGLIVSLEQQAQED